MCGILGELSWVEPASRLNLQALAHRGPDSQGHWLSADQRCWLGHTRLAIQDLSAAGHQPISSHCGRITLVFNGEIYNHVQIREQLDPVSWRGHSDSETLVEALAQQGLEVVSRLLGMYAFAAYDNHTQELWLVRDPLGIKPLYLVQDQGKLQFASERRALLGPRAQLSPLEVADVLSWGHLSSPLTTPHPHHAGVTALPPGAQLRLGSAQPREAQQVAQQIEPSRPPMLGWPIQVAEGEGMGVSGTTHLRQLLEAVVADHLLADVPVACFLSAGLDSGILTALAAQTLGGALNTFTVAFPATEIDEGSAAEAMARHCQAHHTTLVLSEQQTCRWVEEALEAMDSPTADGLNTYIISRAVAEQGIRVALSGLGADELFGGYPSHRVVPRVGMLKHLPRPLLARWLPRLGAKLADVDQWTPWQLALAMRRWASNADLRQAGCPEISWPEGPDAPGLSQWATISLAELQGYTEPMLLRDSDGMSMACGLELRVPFLDQRLVRFALNQPPGAQRPGKTLLRAACEDLFPAGHLDRPKQGFTLPMASWMRGPLRPLCLDRLQSLCRSAWLSPDWVLQQWQRFEAGQLNWPRAWSLVVLGEFAARDVNPSS